MPIVKFNERTIKRLKGDQRKRLILFLSRREAKVLSDFFKQFK